MDNKTQVVEEKIIPLMLELKKTCLLNGIPLFESIAVGDFRETEAKKVDTEDVNENGKAKKKLVHNETGNIYTKYISEIVSPAIIEESLADDKITKMLNVMNGYDTVNPDTRFEFDF